MIACLEIVFLLLIASKAFLAENVKSHAIVSMQSLVTQFLDNVSVFPDGLGNIVIKNVVLDIMEKIVKKDVSVRTILHVIQLVENADVQQDIMELTVGRDVPMAILDPIADTSVIVIIVLHVIQKQDYVSVLMDSLEANVNTLVLQAGMATTVANDVDV